MALFPMYKFDTIRQKADSIRTQYSKNRNVIPVDIDDIVSFGFRLEIRPIEKLKSLIDMEGMLSKDRKTIFVDNETFLDDRFYPRLRFTLAHELGHYILHKEFYESTSFNSPEEWITLLTNIDADELEWCERHADEFAGRLLVPVEILNREVDLIRPSLKELDPKIEELCITGVDEIQKWKASFVARKIASKFKVSQQVIEIRIKVEKITL